MPPWLCQAPAEFARPGGSASPGGIRLAQRVAVDRGGGFAGADSAGIDAYGKMADKWERGCDIPASMIPMVPRIEVKNEAEVPA
jgi:hypothetical protein